MAAAKKLLANTHYQLRLSIDFAEGQTDEKKMEIYKAIQSSVWQTLNKYPEVVVDFGPLAVEE